MNNFKLFDGFCFMTEKLTDICNCSVAFAIEKFSKQKSLIYVELCFPFRRFVHLTSSGFAHFLVVWWRERGKVGCGCEMFIRSSLFILYLMDSPSINVAYNDDPGFFEIVDNSMYAYPVNIIDGEYSNIAQDFEILEVFFENKIINWINCNYTWGWHDDETGRWTGAVGQVNTNTFFKK